MSKDSAISFTREEHAEVEAHCVTALFERARKATLIAPLGTLFVFWLEREVVPLNLLLFWMILNTLPDAITFGLTSRLLKQPPPNERIGYWHNCQLVLRTLQGLCWGSTVILFHGHGLTDLINDIIILTVLIAVSSAGIVNTAPSYRTSVGFSTGVLILPICHYLWLGDAIYFKLASGVGILLLVQFQFGWDAYRQFLEGVQQLVLNRRMSRQLEQRNKELDELNRQLSVLATHDKLTGLYNRHFMVDQLQQQRELFQRYGNACSIVLLDIDHFKQVNDHHGHAVGDQVLVAFCRRIEALLRQEDSFGRHGGEEFLLVLPMTDLSAALMLAERIRSTVAGQPLVTEPVPLTITASFGVAQLQSGEAIDAWLLRADQALYRAKEKGRNCVVAD